jgi:hypothetical protein
MTKLLNHSPLPTLSVGEEAQLEPSTLLLAEDDLWRSVRAAWAPAFSSQRCGGWRARQRRGPPGPPRARSRQAGRWRWRWRWR